MDRDGIDLRRGYLKQRSQNYQLLLVSSSKYLAATKTMIQDQRKTPNAQIKGFQTLNTSSVAPEVMDLCPFLMTRWEAQKLEEGGWGIR